MTGGEMMNGSAGHRAAGYSGAGPKMAERVLSRSNETIRNSRQAG